MKKKLMSNWSLKLVSVLFAMILWLVVVNVDDPVTTRKFKDISVVLLNERLISDAGEVYEVLDESNKVTITVKAKRSVVESLSNSDFRVTADFAERISENSIPIKVVATKRSGDIVDIYLQNNTVKISVEKKVHKMVPVELALSGKAAEGYTIGTSSVTPGEIEIAGPSSVVSKVSKVVVPLDVSGISEDISATLKGSFYDESGMVINNPQIEGDISHIQVQVDVLHTKSIDLNLMTEGEPAEGYWCQDTQYTPTTITIAGEPENLEKINTLVIPPSELNIEGARETMVREIDISQYLPSELIICGEENKKIRVTVVIAALDGKEFRIPLSHVDVLNTPAGIDTVLDDTKTVSVVVKGSGEALNQLNVGDIKLSIDIKGKPAGTYNLQAEVTVPNGYLVMNKPMVSITLLQSGEGEPPTHSEQPPASTNSMAPTIHPQSSTMPASATPVPTPTPSIPVESSAPTPIPSAEEHPGEEQNE